MGLELIDFVTETDGVELEDFPPEVQDRINTALSDLTGGDGGPSNEPDNPPQSIVVSESGGDGELEFASIQTAIDEAADPGDVIFVEAGTYEEDVTADVDDLTLEGPNAGIAGDSAERGDEANIKGLVAIDSEQVTVDGFAIEREGAGGVNEAAVIQIGATGEAGVANGTGAKIVNNKIKPIDSNDDESYLAGVAIESADDVSIRANLFTEPNENNALAVNRFLSNINGLTITYNTIETARGIVSGGDAQVGRDPLDYGLSIKHNKFNNGEYSIALFATEGSLDVNIARNEFNGNNLGEFYVESEISGAGIEDSEVDLSAILNANDNTFNPDGEVVGDLIVPEGSAPEDTVLNVDTAEQFNGDSAIQDAIDAAAPDETLRVGAGTYEESVTADVEGLTLEGAGTESTTIGSAEDPTGIDIKADGITVTELSVDGVGGSYSDSADEEVQGIFIGDPTNNFDNSSQISIDTVNISNINGASKSAEGIHIKSYDDGSSPVDDVNISNVNIESVDSAGAGGNGIKLQADTQNIDITDCNISNITGEWAYGVVLTASSGESGTPSDVSLTSSSIGPISGRSYDGTGVGIDSASGKPEPAFSGGKVPDPGELSFQDKDDTNEDEVAISDVDIGILERNTNVDYTIPDNVIITNAEQDLYDPNTAAE